MIRHIPLKSTQILINAGGMVNYYGRRAVANLYQNNDNKANLFANMLALSEKDEKSYLDDEKSYLDDESIIKEASNFILAGADTTSNTLTYLIWSVLRQPGLQERLVSELASVGEDFSDADLDKLPVLNATIEETLRLYGAVPGNLSRLVPMGGTTLGPYAIPSGCEVETQAYTLHRDPNIFPNPLQ